MSWLHPGQDYFFPVSRRRHGQDTEVPPHITARAQEKTHLGRSGFFPGTESCPVLLVLGCVFHVNSFFSCTLWHWYCYCNCLFSCPIAVSSKFFLFQPMIFAFGPPILFSIPQWGRGGQKQREQAAEWLCWEYFSVEYHSQTMIRLSGAYTSPTTYHGYTLGLAKSYHISILA